MDLKITSCLGLLITAIVWLGCQPAPKTTQSVIEPTEQPDVTPTAHVDILPPPSGLAPETVQPWRGDELDYAQMALDQVLAGLDQPDFLPAVDANATPEDDQADPIANPPAPEVQPPLAAQRSYLAGRVAWRNRKLFEAIRHLEASLRLAPHNPDILRLLGMIYVQSGNHVRGGTYLEKAVAQNPQDIDSLFRLGRILVQQDRWSDAIATYAYAAQLETTVGDPALGPLIQYFLGHALAHEGYDATAIELLTAHVKRPHQFARTTRMVRQLMVLGRQRHSTWETIGDAYNRLNQPEDALLAYEEAVRAHPDTSGGLVSRYVYTCLRLEKSSPALKLLVQYIQRHGADPTSLELVGYLSDHGTGKDVLAKILRKVYNKDNHPGPLAATIAKLLEPADAYLFLASHLREKPADRAVFTRFVELSQSAHGPGLSDVIATAIDIIEQLPTAAEEYSSIIINNAADPATLLKAIQALPPDQRDRPVTRFMAGQTHRRLGQATQAIAAFKQAVAADPTLVTAQIELATLLVEQDDFQAAGELLEGLSQQKDMRIVKLQLKVILHDGQISDAIQYLNQQLENAPTHKVDLIIEKAKLQLVMGDAPQAHQTLVDILETHPQAEQVYEILIRIYRANQISNASRQYQQLVPKMLKTIPHTRVARTERARLLVVSSKFDQAEPILRALLAEDPDNLSPVDPLLLLLVKTDRRPQADELITTRLQAAPDHQQLLALAVHHYRRVEDHPKVVETINRLLSLLMAEERRDLPAINLMLEFLVDANDDTQGRALLEQALADEPADLGLLTLARQHYERIGDQQRFMETTEQLLLLRDPSPVRSQNLAVLYIQNDQHQKAIDVLAEALANSSGDEHARIFLNLMTRSLSDSGQPEKAYVRYESAIQRYPEQAVDLTFDWAMLCDRNGDREQAEKILVGLLKAQPDHAMANNALGYAWANRGHNLQRAKEMIEVAAEAEPNNAAFLDSMGWVFYKLGQFQEAVVWLRRAKIAPGGEYPVIVDHLGDALYRLGETQRATSTWRAAQKQLEQLKEEDDPELNGLAQSLQAKISAVKAQQDPPVADAPDAHEETPEEQSTEQSDTTPDEAAPEALQPAITPLPDAALPAEKTLQNQP